MTIETYWTIPVRGDGPSGDPSRWGRSAWNVDATTRLDAAITDPRLGRSTHGDYLVQIARAAQATGFTGLFVPYDALGEESWVLATALAYEAPLLRLVPEIQPGFATAVYSAKLALSFQRFFDDRLDWKLALDTDPKLQRRVGDTVEGPARLDRAKEFLDVTRGVWDEESFTHLGTYFEVEGGGLFGSSLTSPLPDHDIARRPAPRVFLAGTTADEIELSARFADVHVFQDVDPADLSAAIARHRERAEAHGRTVAYALQLSTVAREFSDEAWLAARRLWADTPGDQSGFDELVAGGLRWHGFDRIGAATRGGLIGSFAEVQEALADYVARGVTVFIFDAVPRLEEVHRLGEFVLPQLEHDLASAGVSA